MSKISPLTFKDLLDSAMASAIADRLAPTEESNYVYWCRQYSKTFHTPLTEVLKLNPVHVVKMVYEDMMDSDSQMEENVDKYLETIYGIEDPEYETLKDKDEEEYLALAEEEEAERLRLGKPIHKALKDETSLPDSLPKSGGINLSYLENSKNER